MTEQSGDGGSVALAHLKALDQAITCGTLVPVRSSNISRKQKSLTRCILLAKGERRSTGKRIAVHADERIDVPRKQLLDEGLKLDGGFDDITQTPRNGLGVVAHHTSGKGRGVTQARIDLPESRKLRTDVGELLTRLSLFFPQIRESGDCRVKGIFSLLSCRAGVIQLRDELVGTIAAMGQRSTQLIGLVIDLFKATGIHIILELGVGKRLLNLDEFEGGTIRRSLDLTLLPRERGDNLTKLDSSRVELIGGRLKGGNVLCSHGGRRTLLIKLPVDVGKLLHRSSPLVFGAGKGATHLGEARDHITPLLLEQTHIRTDSPDDILHMTALFTKVTNEQPFFLEHDLELLELALLFA